MIDRKEKKSVPVYSEMSSKQGFNNLGNSYLNASNSVRHEVMWALVSLQLSLQPCNDHTEYSICLYKS